MKTEEVIIDWLIEYQKNFVIILYFVNLPGFLFEMVKFNEIKYINIKIYYNWKIN